MPIYTTTSSDYNNLHNLPVSTITTTYGTSTMPAEYFFDSAINFTITEETSNFTITDESGNERVVFRGQINLYPVNTDDKDIDDTTSEELDRFLSGFRIKKTGEKE